MSKQCRKIIAGVHGWFWVGVHPSPEYGENFAIQSVKQSPNFKSPAKENPPGISSVSGAMSSFGGMVHDIS